MIGLRLSGDLATAHEELLNWALWARSSAGPRRCGSAEKFYIPEKLHWTDGKASPTDYDLDDAERMERLICSLRDRTIAQYLISCYAFRMKFFMLCRALGTGRRGLEVFHIKSLCVVSEIWENGSVKRITCAPARAVL